MHTVTVLINHQSYRLRIAELLPLLHQKILIQNNQPAKIEEVIHLLKCFSPIELVKFITNQLHKEIVPKQAYSVKFYQTIYKSTEEYEEKVTRKYADLNPGQAEYNPDGSIKNIHDLTKFRVEIELAKNGFVYNYTTVEEAKVQLRKIAEDCQTPSPILTSVITRSQAARSTNNSTPHRNLTGRIVDYKEFVRTSKSFSQLSLDDPTTSQAGTTQNNSDWQSQLHDFKQYRNTKTADSISDTSSEKSCSIAAVEEATYVSPPNPLRPSRLSEDPAQATANAELLQQHAEEETRPLQVHNNNEVPLLDQGDIMEPLAPQPQMKRLRLGDIQLQFFYGKEPTETEEYLRQLDHLKSFYDWDDATTIKAFAYKLKDPARMWYDNQEDELRAMAWADIKKVVRKKFQRVPGRTSLVSFTSRMQRPDETPTNYLETMIHLRRQLETELTDIDFIQIVINGLISESRRMVRMFPNQTLGNLRTNIENAEEATAISSVPVSTVNTSTSFEGIAARLERLESLITNADAHNLGTMQQPPVPNPQTVQPIGTDQLSAIDQRILATVAAITQVKCYNCQEIGHFASHCPKPDTRNPSSRNHNQAEQQTSSTTNAGNAGKSNIHLNIGNRSRSNSLSRNTSDVTPCPFCNRTGHTLAQCYDLKDLLKLAKLGAQKNG